jgi:hypothetical protein
MFLNVRLLVVAVLAAIAGITCGLGLFATFRVNHEPLARFSEGGPPLQLAFDNLAPMPDTAAPMTARYPLNGAAKPLSAPVLIPPPNRAWAQDPAEAGLAPGEGAANAQDRAATAAPADQKDETSVAMATPGEQSAGVAENIEMARHATDVAASGEQEAGKTPPPPAAGSGATESIVDSGTTDVAAEKTALANSDAQIEEPAVKETKARPSDVAKPPAKAARPAKPTRRATKAARVRRRPTTVAAQPANVWTQPTYQWTDTTQTPQTVRRVVVKRHHAAKQAAPVAQSNLTGATAGVLGAQ